MGIPGQVPSEGFDSLDANSYLELAEENKIPLLFLESIPEREKENLEGSRYEDWYENTLKLAIFTTRKLRDEGIEHTFFKTFKPFPYTPSDVDVLLRYEDDLDYAIGTFEKEGFKSLERSFYGSTLFSPEHDLNLDLTTRIDVSGLIYLDKERIFEETEEKNLKNCRVRTPKPPTDLSIVASHSLYKEQMFLMSDYYTLLMQTEYLGDALEFAEKAKVKPALLWALDVTSTITESAFGPENKLTKELDSLLRDEAQTWKAEKEFSKMPYNCSITLLIKALVRKMSEDQKARKSTPKFLKNFFNPSTILETMGHFRESY